MSDRGRALAGAAFVFALALGIRGVGLGQDAAGDELYNFLAARQYNVDGTLSIHGGEPYDRAAGFTLVVAMFLRGFGDSLAVARVPAALAGSLTAAVVFFWLRRRGHALAAWIAGALVVLAPLSLVQSQQVRFYTFQELAFVLGCLGVYAAIEPWTRPRADSTAPEPSLRGGYARAGSGRGAANGFEAVPASLARSLLLLAAAAVAHAIAFSLQPVSVIGLAGLGVWAVASAAAPVRRWASRSRGRRRLVLAGVVAALPLGAAVLASETASQYATLLGRVDLWARPAAEEIRFYHWILLENYPAIWTLFPLAALAAVAAAPRPASLAICVFGAAFTGHSLVSWKAERYLAYAMPFFFVIGALALAEGARLVRALASRVLDAWLPTAGAGARRLAPGVALAAVAAFFVAANPAFSRTAKLLARDPRLTHPGMGKGTISWSRAAPILKAQLGSENVVVSTEDLKALHYLGRLDYVLNKDHLSGWAGEFPEFRVDPRVARPVVSTPESVRRIMGCHPSGIVVAQTWVWGLGYYAPVVRFLEESLEPVPLPEEYGIRAFRWTTPPEALAADCPPPTMERE